MATQDDTGTDQRQGQHSGATMSLKKASRTKSLSLSGDDFPLRPVKPRPAFTTPKRPEDTMKIMKYIDDNVIGKGVAFLGPFGRRKGKLSGNSDYFRKMCVWSKFILNSTKK